jgi:7-carboxy-7-deazaguanine synthase
MHTKSTKSYKYSEIFGNTIQGEGHYTGVPTVWVRFWGCNFNCDGFGQDNPADPSSYILDYQTVDVSSIKRMEDLPVFNRGCDSSYSWSKKYAHLAHTGTPEQICDLLEGYLRSPSNPEGKFLHPKSKQWSHMAFTGGEPMMNQNAIVDIMLEFARRGNMPKYVTVETNGTQKARDKFSTYLTGNDEHETSLEAGFEQSKQSFFMAFAQNLCAEGLTGLPPELKELQGIEWFWSVSPKLYLSGEQWDDAVKPEVVAGYNQLSNKGQLKYVCDGSERAWAEVERATELYREAGIDWPVWIMPVGATVEGQAKVAAMVAEEAVARGYNVAARVHAYLFKNVIGK